ncbi:hypothetical protein ACQP2X_11560 [Actinoplanes sp. CA-131856]
MKEPRSPWWREVDDAVALLSSMLNSAAGRAERDGRYEPPPGAPVPRRRRRPASLRHIAEVIRTHRFAVGVDKDDVARVLAAEPRALADPLLVVAVVRACHQIAGQEFGLPDAARFAAAAARITALTEAARAADERAPFLVPAVRRSAALVRPPVRGEENESQRARGEENESRHAPGEENESRHAPGEANESRRAPGEDNEGPPALEAEADGPRVIDGQFVSRRWRWPRSFGQLATTAAVALVAALIGAVVALKFAQRADPAPAAVADLPCRDGASGADLVESSVVSPDEQAQVIEPFLDFDEMNGSARYNRYAGRTYYWGRAGSDDNVPRSGGARIRWQPGDGRWRSCPVTLARSERDYVRTMAVATTIDGHAVRVQVCLWRDEPYRENCTQVFS